MGTVSLAIDRIVRQALSEPALPLPKLLGCIVAGGFLYGAVMGSFGIRFDERILMALFSAIKVPLLLLVCFAMTLPIFLVINTLLGLRSDVAEVIRAILSGQAALALVLCALAPYTVLWYASSGSYHAAQLFNLVMFAVASVAAQVVLRRSYRPLIARDPRHRFLIWAWLLLYSFVAVQMAWVLRPFIGAPESPVQFFRDEPLSDNAYMVVLRLVFERFGRQLSGLLLNRGSGLL